MVLTKQELISSLRSEVRILLHLSSKIDKSKLDYRPTPKQRSILELLQYMAIMGPTQIAAVKAGVFTREAMMALWGLAEESAEAMNFDKVLDGISTPAIATHSRSQTAARLSIRRSPTRRQEERKSRLEAGGPGAAARRNASRPTPPRRAGADRSSAPA